MSHLPESPVHVGQVLHPNTIASHVLPANTVFIDQGSRWSNPYRRGIDGTLDDICDRFDFDLAHDITKLQALDELQGMDLLSFTAGQRSHGDTLVKLAAMKLHERYAWAEDILGCGAQRQAA